MLLAVTLEAEASAVIDQLNALGRPSFEDVGHERARAGFEEMPPAGEFVEIATTEDRTVPGPDGNDIAVRIYRPGEGAATADDSGTLGCLVYFHGGGWVVGSIQTHDRTCRSLTMLAGVVTVSADYRLAPEHRFPAAIDDCCAATQWVVDHAGELGVDPARVAVGGDSAGGNLAAAVALKCRDGAAAGEACSQPALQVLVYPVTDFERNTPSMIANAEGYLLTRSTMTWFDDHYCPPSERSNPYAAPLAVGDPAGAAPALVIVAGHDPLRDEGVAYAHQLADAGVPTTLIEYPGQFHGFFGMTRFLSQAREAQELTASILRRELAPAG
ncbi:alpha/beta hydrolase [Candidatus Poriferisodalis sp.]|uniref:alpha/beta hydrolase n=1 Tax=Candidatus Poriferisodalis sp. TaxID=3101277 RepID=UPI003B02A355